VSSVHHLALVVLFYSITNFVESLFSFVVRSFSSWVPEQVLDVSFACFTDINDFPSSVGREVREQPQVKFFSY
jgi:hypothetical protein